MINFYESYVVELGFELAILGSAVRRTPYCAMETGIFQQILQSPSRKHTYIILTPPPPPHTSPTPMKPHFYMVKLGLQGKHYFSYYCLKTYIVGTR